MTNDNEILNVFTYKTANDYYSFDNQFDVINAPEDADWDRWAMLNDGSNFRLYCFKQYSNNTLYQFAFNGTAYEFGYESTKELTLNNVPASANTYAFAMLHDSKDYRLYLGNSNRPTQLYQFIWKNDVYEYLEGDEMTITGIPKNVNLGRIAMLYNNTESEYAVYALDIKNSVLHQAIYNADSGTYNAVNNVEVADLTETDINNFAMVYGEDTYWLYI